MGNPLRNRDPNAFRLVTNRTLGARLWMQPNAKNRKLIGGIVARYQELLRIEIYAYCFLSNHYHMIIRAPQSNADEFFENVNREISRRMNWQLRREGSFWHRRYSEQHVLSEDDLLEAFLYVNTNPTKHGLLRRSSEWKGLNSYQQSIKGKKARFSFTMFSESKLPQKRHELKLSVLPQFKSMNYKARRARIEALLLERQNDIATSRYELGQGFLGAERIAQQLPDDIPIEISRSPRPVCYTKSYELRREFKERERERRRAYANCSYLYRFDVKNIVFPEHCYLPPKHRLPRRAPFIIDEAPEIFLKSA